MFGNICRICVDLWHDSIRDHDRWTFQQVFTEHKWAVGWKRDTLSYFRWCAHHHGATFSAISCLKVNIKADITRFRFQHRINDRNAVENAQIPLGEYRKRLLIAIAERKLASKSVPSKSVLPGFDWCSPTNQDAWVINMNCLSGYCMNFVIAVHCRCEQMCKFNHDTLMGDFHSVQNIARSIFRDHILLKCVHSSSSNKTSSTWLSAFQKKAIAKSRLRDILHWMEIRLKLKR